MAEPLSNAGCVDAAGVHDAEPCDRSLVEGHPPGVAPARWGMGLVTAVSLTAFSTLAVITTVAWSVSAV